MDAWTTVFAGIILLGAGLAPIADEITPDTLDEETSPAATHHVHIENFEMDPLSLTIEQGDTVEWHNHDSVAHTATADDGSWDTGTISSGETEAITFDETLEDDYHCEFHTDMTGYSLEVIEPNEQPSVTIDSPADGDDLQGVVDIEGTASDPDGDDDLTEVEVRIDGGDWQTASGTTDWSLSWDTSEVPDGSHTIEARSFDGFEHSPIATVDVTTDNPQPDLGVSELTTEAGLDQATITATVANTGDAPAEATSLEVAYESDNAQGTVTSADIAALAEGEQTQLEIAWDTLGKVGEFTIVAELDAPASDVNADNDADSEPVCVPGVEGVTCTVPGTEAPLP